MARNRNYDLGNFTRIFHHYKNLALNLYRWENLPKGVESRHIEHALFSEGQAFFVDDPQVGFICLPCYSNNNVNVYGEPTEVQVVGFNYSETFSMDEGVRIINNDSLMPTIIDVRHYAQKMDEIEQTLNMNLKQQRFPYIVATTKDTEFSMKTIMNKVMNGELAIYYDKKLNNDEELGIEVLPTQAPYIVDKLQQQKLELEKEFLTRMGLNSVVQKKERLVTDEANANNSAIEMNLDIGFKERELACKRINEKFGLNIKVVKVAQELEELFLTTLNRRIEENKQLEGGEDV